MKFQDLFLPRWQHSNPEIRQNAVARLKNPKLLAQIVEKDPDEEVRKTAAERLSEIQSIEVNV
jgi:hypothetical protein